MIKIKLIPAEYGDAILISITDSQDIHILIDGGTKETYEEFIKQEMSEIKRNGQKLNLLICTHMDYDHIGGLVQLLKNTRSQEIGSVWYNGFLQIVDNRYYTQKDNEFTSRDNKILDDIISKGTMYEGQQDIGINDGMALGTLLEEKQFFVNSIVCGKAISTEFLTQTKPLGENIEITLLGPSKDRLQQLEDSWKKKMISNNYTFRVSDEIKLMEAFEYQLEAIKLFYAEERTNVSRLDELEKYIGDLNEIDSSITNGSSISFILHHKKEKFLFLGDAIIDDILLKNIESVVGHTYRFTSIKLPHHGSRYNITREFIERYKADEYYCMTDSKRYNHPDLAVLATIICSDPVFKTIIFNYPIDKALFLEHHQEWKDKYNYEIVMGTGKSPVERIFE